MRSSRIKLSSIGSAPRAPSSSSSSLMPSLRSSSSSSLAGLQSRGRTALPALFLLSLAATAACGEDEPPPPPPRSSRATRAAAAPAAGARGGTAEPETLPSYRKVEDVVSPVEAPVIRHRFKADDFVNDPSGTASRDPFRSYIIAQVSATPSTDVTTTDATAKTEKCANKKIAAAGYSTQELRLIGVVSRGTVRFATFSDTADVGWVVKRGDCIGSEHARVKLIGEAFVTLEYPGAPVSPSAAATDPAPRADEREYQLYPKELSTERNDEDDGDLKIRRRPPIRALPTVPTQPEPAALPTGGAIRQ